jgi:hypothetical protein
MNSIDDPEKKTRWFDIVLVAGPTILLALAYLFFTH